MVNNVIEVVNYLIAARPTPRNFMIADIGEYADYHKTHRPHRTLSHRPPDGRTHIAPADDNIRVRRRDRLGRLIHEYSQVA